MLPIFLTQLFSAIPSLQLRWSEQGEMPRFFCTIASSPICVQNRGNAACFKLRSVKIKFTDAFLENVGAGWLMQF